VIVKGLKVLDELDLAGKSTFTPGPDPFTYAYIRLTCKGTFTGFHSNDGTGPADRQLVMNAIEEFRAVVPIREPTRLLSRGNSSSSQLFAICCVVVT
jgi:hypothetical protein